MDSACTVQGCPAKATRLVGLCERHYRRLKKYGETFGAERLPSAGWFQRKNAIANFWSKIDRRGPDECWPWTASCVRGYGRAWTGEREVKAHRWAYELTVGPIPDGMLVCHTCDNPPCCNPAHLFVGTNDDNMADKKAKGRNCYGDANGSRKFPERRPRGDTSPVARLLDSQAQEIFDRYRAGGETHKSLARQYNVSHSLIGLVVNAEGRYVWLRPSLPSDSAKTKPT